MVNKCVIFCALPCYPNFLNIFYNLIIQHWSRKYINYYFRDYICTKKNVIVFKLLIIEGGINLEWNSIPHIRLWKMLT